MNNENRFLIDESNIENNFNQLAKWLLNEVELIINDATYHFTEIEFYFQTDGHNDETTHKHNFEAGKWRTHGSGIDLTLRQKNDTINSNKYGGILIRGLKKLNSNEEQSTYINGPQRCLAEMMSNFNNVFTIQQNFGIKQRKVEENDKVYAIPRVGLNKEKEMSDSLYRYIKNVKHFSSEQFAGKEKITKQLVRDGKLKVEEAKEFIGYDIKLNKADNI